MSTRNIDIVTSQNVVISYELATLANRLLSNFIDIFIVHSLNFIRWQFKEESMGPERWPMLLVQGIFFIWLYHLVFAIFFRGSTLGMRAVGLKIMKPSGGNVEFSDLFLRWIVRPLDITLSGGALAIFLILGSEKRQRLGDMLAGTVIINKRHHMHFALQDILSFHEKSNAEGVKYPNVRHIRESDMLLIKNLLNNQSGYSSSVHKRALDDCAKNMARLMELEETPRESNVFLQSLVNDYIILTR